MKNFSFKDAVHVSVRTFVAGCLSSVSFPQRSAALCMRKLETDSHAVLRERGRRSFRNHREPDENRARSDRNWYQLKVVRRDAEKANSTLLQ